MELIHCNFYLVTSKATLFLDRLQEFRIPSRVHLHKIHLCFGLNKEGYNGHIVRVWFIVELSRGIKHGEYSTRSYAQSEDVIYIRML